MRPFSAPSTRPSCSCSSASSSGQSRSSSGTRRESPSWRGLADAGVLVGSFLPALLFGVAFANIFKGIPIDGDGVFHGNLLTLLNPYGLAGGLFFLALFLVHGALWITHRSTGAVRDRSRDLARLLWLPLTLLAVIFLVLTALYTRLWANYLAAPILLIIPLLAVLALLAMRYLMARAMWGRALLTSFGVILFSVLFGVTGLYPFLLPSTLDNAYSLSVRNAASSPSALAIMLVVALIFVPLVIIYQAWVYRLFLKKESGPI